VQPSYTKPLRAARPPLRYNRPMRRLLAIFLLCALGLPMATPLFAAALDQDTGLPACCRRNGAHHCTSMMTGTSARPEGTQVAAPHERCPAYPAATTSVRKNDASLLAASPLLSDLPQRTAETTAVAIWTAAALSRSQHERGPPPQRA
jgi:hypothetical protein